MPIVSAHLSFPIGEAQNFFNAFVIITAGKKHRFLKRVFRFLGFFCTKTEHESATQKHEKHPVHGTPYLNKSPVSEGEVKM